MVQRRRRPRLSAEAFQGLRVFGHCVRKGTSSDHAAEFEVFGLVDNTHAAAAEFLDDTVVRDGLADHGEGCYGASIAKSMKYASGKLQIKGVNFLAANVAQD